MERIFIRLLVFLFLIWIPAFVSAQTAVPNGSFETWNNYSGYSDPQYWDTPNQEISAIPFFGTTVVTKSSDHEDGSYSAKLESKHITLPPMDVPGFVTLGKLTIDLGTLAYTVTGGWPISDNPTHLKGFYKYLPQGGDSCLIAIGLFKTVGNARDTIANGYFSTHDVVSDWTPFSAWINYDSIATPDSMNIFALSSAEETAIAGSILYLDNISLDYTVGIDRQNPQTGIEIFQDRETNRLLLFYDFEKQQDVSVSLYDITGREAARVSPVMIKKDRMEIAYGHMPPGVYILNIIHDRQKFSRKFVLNPR
ncbi:MAG: PCMD domain-containing protein [Bacteroidetes bacterium]|nr:PCMD domain-containing protein [Bacteroidota bacterium]